VGNCEGFVSRATFVDGQLRLNDPQKFTDLGFLKKRPPKPGSSFFQNRACEHFPCHEGVPEDEFNCLFCYCPLYALGPGCGGNFSYTKRGRKNCTGCTLPHQGEDGVKLVAKYYEQLADLARK
jgi:Zn-finger protein